MTTTNIRRGLAKGFGICLVFLCLWGIAPGAWAAYEVSVATSTPFVAPMTAYAKCIVDITVSWTAPGMTGADSLNGYIYKWNSSDVPMDDTAFNATTGWDGILDKDVTNAVKSKTDLAGLDSDQYLYLHIKTLYMDATVTGTLALSADVVYGPFLIDNVAPTGTIRIVDASGNDIASISDTILNLKLAASKDPTQVYLSETSTRPASGSAFSADVLYGLADTTPGAKTIYGWFEDAVGNISSIPATDTVTLLAGTSINPNTATLDLAAGATQIFRVEGTNATYNWSIINQVPETSGTVATITVGGSATNAVTVTGLVKGTFQLQAVATSGTGTLTSGTISVIQNYIKGDVNSDGFIDSGDAILILRYSVGLATLTDVQKLAGEVTGDSTLDSGDAIKILRYSVGLISSL